MKYEKTHLVTAINNGITETLSYASLPGNYEVRPVFNVYMIFVQDNFFDPSTHLQLHYGENKKEHLDKEWFFGQAKRCIFHDNIYWKFMPIVHISPLSKYHFRIKSRPLFDIPLDSPANNYTTSIDLIGETITPENKNDEINFYNETFHKMRKDFFTQ